VLVPRIADAAVLRAPVIVVSLVLVVVGAMRYGLIAATASTLTLSAVAALGFAPRGARGERPHCLTAAIAGRRRRRRSAQRASAISCKRPLSCGGTVGG
jgi:mannose/fructose/N-acetylgalactosamine-specific phosphotransferase system component IIC